MADKLGIDIVSVSRSGGSNLRGSSRGNVTWVSGDLLSNGGDGWIKHLEGADGAISCVGAFGSNAYMERVNGDANINAVSACIRSGVGRFTFISTVENNLPGFILSG